MKEQLRLRAKLKLKQLTKNEKQNLDFKIQRNAFEKIATMNLKNIGLYVPIYHEVRIDYLVNLLIENKYNISFPVWNHNSVDENLMQFVEVSGKNYDEILSKMQPNKHFPKYLQPKIEENKFTVPEVLIIHCVAFNDAKFRLGYGGGYYDRYLATYKNTKTISLAYLIQKVSENFQEKLDIPMDFVICE